MTLSNLGRGSKPAEMTLPIPGSIGSILTPLTQAKDKFFLYNIGSILTAPNLGQGEKFRVQYWINLDPPNPGQGESFLCNIGSILTALTRAKEKGLLFQ